jgi:hypothetical protein
MTEPRPLPELYKLLLDFFNEKHDPLCLCMSQMFHLYLIDEEEWEWLENDMIERKPPNTGLGFWWHSSDRESRQQFLRNVIQELENESKVILSKK